MAVDNISSFIHELYVIISLVSVNSNFRGFGSCSVLPAGHKTEVSLYILQCDLRMECAQRVAYTVLYPLRLCF